VATKLKKFSAPNNSTVTSNVNAFVTAENIFVTKSVVPETVPLVNKCVEKRWTAKTTNVCLVVIRVHVFLALNSLKLHATVALQRSKFHAAKKKTQNLQGAKRNAQKNPTVITQIRMTTIVIRESVQHVRKFVELKANVVTDVLTNAMITSQ
jgi:hypothetical protein